jgi:hypothetical protein
LTPYPCRDKKANGKKGEVKADCYSQYNFKDITMLKNMSLFIIIMLTFNGCSLNRYKEVKDTDWVGVSYDAANTLQQQMSRPLPKNSLIVVSTLLNVDDLKQTSSFGRIVANQIASAFHNAGYRIIGMEMPIDLFTMEEGGALHLTDEVKAMLRQYNPAALVGGVYAPGKRTGYVSLRIVDLNDRTIISSTDLSIPMGPDAKLLLESKEVGSNDIKTKQSGEAGSVNEIDIDPQGGF